LQVVSFTQQGRQLFLLGGNRLIQDWRDID